MEKFCPNFAAKNLKHCNLISREYEHIHFQQFVSFVAFMNFYIQAKNPIQTSQFFEVEGFQEFCYLIGSGHLEHAQAQNTKN